MDNHEKRRPCRCVCGRETVCESAAAGSRRESLWSVSPAWRNAFFSMLGVSLLISSCAIIAYTLINMGDAGIMETYLTTAERILINGGALAILIYSVTDSWEAMMVLANYLRQNLLEPLKERQRREGLETGIVLGREEGLEEGIALGREEGREEGKEEGRSESNAKWRAWNERREKAAARGEPFDEPPPNFDA